MKLSEFSLNALVPIINQDNCEKHYRSGPALIKMFNACGLRDVYNKGLPDNDSRKNYTQISLAKVNGSPDFRRLVESIVIGMDDAMSAETVKSINRVIAHDGFELTLTSTGIYKISGAETPDPVVAEAHFSEIHKKIIEKLNSARFTIWIAVAWFTDAEIGEVLNERHRAGLNVRIIVNDDDNTRRNGLPLEKIGCEYNKVAPDSEWGKKIMHHKFCVCDLKTVIHGSYNWTGNARKYNNEGITIVESREVAESFSNEFLKLKSMGAMA